MNRRSLPEPIATKPSSKKDKKRWCKGKPGVEHEYDWAVPVNACNHSRDREYLVCQKCGKMKWDSRCAKCHQKTYHWTRSNPCPGMPVEGVKLDKDYPFTF